MRWPQRWSTVATEQGLAGAAQEIKVCTISSTLGEGGPGGARFDRDMPTAMVQLGMASYDWSELIGEANLCLRLPFTITGALLCCIPSLFVDDYDRAVNRRGRQVVASWQEEHRLPKGLCIIEHASVDVDDDQQTAAVIRRAVAGVRGDHDEESVYGP
eukprot:jgi/Tetstr1/425047/TSEL_015512.t1